MANESQLKHEGGNRPKIQDIIPRKNRRDSLLIKIMGSGSSVPSSAAKDTTGGFLRSLPFGRGRHKKAEKIIRLKKWSSEHPAVPASGVKLPQEKKSVLSRRGVVKDSAVSFETRSSAKTSADVTKPGLFRRMSRRYLIIFAAGVCAAIFVLLLSFVFARATVSLEPSFAMFALDGIRIEAAAKVSEIDIAGKKIPAFLLETAGSVKREFSASIRERVSRRASGTVRIYNAFGSSPQTLVARTRLQDSAGRIFLLKQRVTVPGAKIQDGKIVASSVIAGVEASRAGEEFNIQPGRFTIPGFSGSPKFSGFYAESSEPFSGGFEGDALVVKQSDIDMASEAVTAALFADLKEALERKVPSAVTVIPGAREIVITALRKPNAGAVQDNFIVEADGRASAMLFRTDDLFLLLEKLAVAPDAKKRASREKSNFAFDRASLSVKDRAVLFDVSGSLAVFSALEPEDIQRVIGGKRRADAENILRADSRIRAFGIKLFPFWRNVIPSDIGKIRVFIAE